MSRKTEQRKPVKKTDKPNKTTKKDTKKDDKPKFDYLIKCLLNPEIKKGDVVMVESNTFQGTLKVLGIEIQDFVMSLKCKVQN